MALPLTLFRKEKFCSTLFLKRLVILDSPGVFHGDSGSLHR